MASLLLLICILCCASHSVTSFIHSRHFKLNKIQWIVYKNKLSVATESTEQLNQNISYKNRRITNGNINIVPRKSKYSPQKKQMRFQGGSHSASIVNDTDTSSSGIIQNPAVSESSRSIHNNTSLNSAKDFILNYVRNGRPNDALTLLAETVSSSSNVTGKSSGSSNSIMREYDYNTLIQELGDRGYINACDEVLALMKKDGKKPSILTYNFLISRAGTWQNLNKCELYFQQMRAQGIRPDVRIYNCLINAYAKSGNIFKAFEVLEIHMTQMKVAPTVVTFNTLIDCCVRVKPETMQYFDPVQKAIDVLRMMETYQIKPNLRSYSSFIHVCCESGQIDRAYDTFQTIQQSGLKPAHVTYSILLHSYGQSGDLQKAFEIFELMKQNGHIPNIVTISSLINACSRHGQIDKAFELYEEMLHSKNKQDRPNSITCSGLIDACLKLGQVDKAFKVLEDMKINQIPLTQVTYTSLMCELTKLKKVNYMDDLSFFQIDNSSRNNNNSINNNNGNSSSMPKKAKKTSERRPIEVLAKVNNNDVTTPIATDNTINNTDTCTNQQSSYDDDNSSNKSKKLDSTLGIVSKFSNDQETRRLNDALFLAFINNKFSSNENENENSSIDTTKMNNNNISINDVTWQPLLMDESWIQEANNKTISNSNSNSSSASYNYAFSPFSSSSFSERVDEYERMKSLGISPAPHIYQTLMKSLYSRTVQQSDKIDAMRKQITYHIHSEDLSSSSSSSSSSSKLQFEMPQQQQQFTTNPASEFPKLLIYDSDADKSHISIDPSAIKDVSVINSITPISKIKSASTTTTAPLINSIINEDSGNLEDLTSAWRKRDLVREQSKQIQKNDLFRMYLVFQEMRSISGVQPDIVAYNMLINACAGAGAVDNALETVETMQREGIAPDVITYTSLIKACAINGGVGTIALAEEIFAAMQQRTNHFSSYIEPTELTFQRLIQAHIRAKPGSNNHNNNNHNSNNISNINNPNNPSNTTFKKPSPHKSLSSTLPPITDIKNTSAAASTSITTTPTSGIINGVNTRRIFELYDDMKLRGLKPSIDIHRYIIRAALLDNDIQKSLSIIEIIKNNMSVPVRLQYDYKLWLSVADACAPNGLFKEEGIKLRKEIAMKTY